MPVFAGFGTFHDHEDSLQSPSSIDDVELTLWQRKWERQDRKTTPKTALATLKEITVSYIPTPLNASKYLPPYQSQLANV